MRTREATVFGRMLKACHISAFFPRTNRANNDIFSTARAASYNTTTTTTTTTASACSSSTPFNGKVTHITGSTFRGKTSLELVSALAILKACRVESLTAYGPNMLDLAESLGLGNPAYWFLRKTFFSHFCGGESVDDPQLHRTIARLKQMNIGSILDYSVEAESAGMEYGGNPETVFERTKDTLHKAILLTSKHNENGGSNGFSCLKVTALVEPELLLRMSQLLTANPSHSFDLGLPGLAMTTTSPSFAVRTPSFVFTDAMMSGMTPPPQQPHQPPPTFIAPPPPLTLQEAEQLKRLASRLDYLCSEARRLNVPMLIDAEQTYFQPAIDYMAHAMMARHNVDKSIVYNTYQMYLKDGLPRLQADVAFSRDSNWRLGAKIVRGAYMNSERARIRQYQQRPGKPDAIQDPFNPSIQETHKAYNTAVQHVLDNIDNAALVIATHNQASVDLAAESVRERGLVHKDNKPSAASDRICFAQLYGMADYLTMNLAHNGFHTCKYVPFGPIKEVLPYLIRRLEENRDVRGQATMEVALLKQELKRRLCCAGSK